MRGGPVGLDHGRLPAAFRDEPPVAREFQAGFEDQPAW
jgi:hypothetical protein